MSFLKLETKVDARLIYYNPPDCHPTVLLRTFSVKILPYYLYTINVYAHIHTILYTHTYTHTWTLLDDRHGDIAHFTRYM